MRVEFTGRALRRGAVQKRLAKKRNVTTSDVPATIVRQVMTAVEREMGEEEELGVEGL